MSDIQILFDDSARIVKLLEAEAAKMEVRSALLQEKVDQDFARLKETLALAHQQEAALFVVKEKIDKMKTAPAEEAA